MELDTEVLNELLAPNVHHGEAHDIASGNAAQAQGSGDDIGSGVAMAINVSGSIPTSAAAAGTIVNGSSSATTPPIKEQRIIGTTRTRPTPPRASFELVRM